MWRRPCPTAGWRRGGDRRRGIIANPDRLPRSGAEGGGEPSMNAKRILRIAAVLLAGWLAACTARYPVVGAFDDYDEVFIGTVDHDLIRGRAFIAVKAEHYGMVCQGGSRRSEERREGKEGVSTCRARRSTAHTKKNNS